jgi:hypothetical protein
MGLSLLLMLYCLWLLFKGSYDAGPSSTWDVEASAVTGAPR